MTNSLSAQEDGSNTNSADQDQQSQTQTVALALEKQLAQSLGGGYGGVWIDTNTQRVQVGYVGTQARRQAQTIAMRNDLQDKIDLRPQNYSRQDLVALKNGISAQIQELTSATDWPLQIGMLPSENKIHIQVPKNSKKISEELSKYLKQIQRTHSSVVKISKYLQPAEREACEEQYCDSPLRGAVGLHANSYGYDIGPICTLGFIVKGKTGARYALTAGHCAVGGNGWATQTPTGSLKKIGPIHRNEFRDGGTDGMIVKIREDKYKWTTKSWVFVRAGESWNEFGGPSQNEQYGIKKSGTSGSLVGSRICISGAISSQFEGGSCGTVQEVDVDFTADGITTHGVVRASYCSRSGDSGAPVFSQGMALGIHLGANTGLGTCSDQKYYTGIQPIIRAMNKTISIP